MLQQWLLTRTHCLGVGDGMEMSMGLVGLYANISFCILPIVNLHCFHSWNKRRKKNYSDMALLFPGSLKLSVSGSFDIGLLFLQMRLEE